MDAGREEEQEVEVEEVEEEEEELDTAYLILARSLIYDRGRETGSGEWRARGIDRGW